MGTVNTNERAAVDKEPCLRQNHWRFDIIRISMVVEIQNPCSQEDE